MFFQNDESEMDRRLKDIQQLCFTGSHLWLTSCDIEKNGLLQHFLGRTAQGKNDFWKEKKNMASFKKSLGGYLFSFSQ